MLEAINTTQAMLLLGSGILLVSLITLFVCILALRRVQRLEWLGESRLQYLSEEQERMAFLREERRTLVESLEQERRERLETQRKLEHLAREREELRGAHREDSRPDQKATTEAGPRLPWWSRLSRAYSRWSRKPKD